MKLGQSTRRLDIYTYRKTPELYYVPYAENHAWIMIPLKGNGDTSTSSSMKHTYMLGVPRTNCKDYGIKTVNIPRSRKDASHGRLLEFHVFDLCRETTASSASKSWALDPILYCAILNWCTSNKFVASIPTLVLLFSESYGHNWYLSNTLWIFLCLCFNEK